MRADRGLQTEHAADEPLREHFAWCADMSMWAKWTSINAVARGDFLLVDSDVMHRHTARMILGLRGLCERIDRARRANYQSLARP